MVNWTLEVLDEAFSARGVIQNFKEFSLAVPLNKTRTCSFQMRLDNPLTEELNYEEAPRYIRAKRNGVLLFIGPVITAEESGDGTKETLHVNALGPDWMFAKVYYGIKKIIVFEPAEKRGKILEKIAAVALGLEGELPFSDYHIRLGNLGGLALPTTTYEANAPLLLSTAFKDLGETAEGFDWLVEPIDPFAETVSGHSAQQIGELNIAGVLGTTRENVIFDYGTGRFNVASFKRIRDRTTQVNRVSHFVGDNPEVPNTNIVKNNAGSEKQWGRLEEYISANLLNVGLREKLLEEHIRVRAQPRQTFSFEPMLNTEDGRVPEALVDYFPGDVIGAHIVAAGSERFNGKIRVWEIKYTLDENLKEKVGLVLQQEK